MDIIDHIIQLNEEYGNNAKNTENKITTCQSIIKMYSGMIQLSVSNKYHEAIKYLLTDKKLYFDNYLTYLCSFLNYLTECFLIMNDDKCCIYNYSINNNFTYNDEYYGYFGLKIQFAIRHKVIESNKQLQTVRNNIMIELINIENIDIIDHIKQLDYEHGNKLYDLCQRNETYDAILEFYFGKKSESKRLYFEISELYYKQLKDLLYYSEIDFDQYVLYLQTFFKDLITSNLYPNDDGIINLDGRLRFKKAFKKNEFLFSSIGTQLKIEITFTVKFKQLNPKIFIDSQDTIIELTNITTENLCNTTYWNKLCSRITPYILVFILFLLIIFSYSANDIINLTQYLFDNNVYPKIAALIFIYCGAIAVSPIYKVIDALRKYSKLSLSFKINKKYSNTEKHLNEFDAEKKQSFTIFENRERAVSVPNEDFLGYNLLSASLFYNGIKDSFDPSINLIIIIDARRGMGKTSFINLLVQRINGFTYRHDGGCQLFKQILFNKQIKVVQFSIMPFLATLNNADDEIKCINNFMTYIADNLTPSSSKYLKALLSSTTAFNDKFNLEKFISQITNNDAVDKLKNNLKVSEQKNLIIIEDLDRLNEEQLKVFIKALWLIYELPFTITLLPAEADKIKRAVNLPMTNNGYEEYEEYKLLQPTFPLKDFLYTLLANYTIKIFNDIIHKWQINSEITQLKQLNNHETEINDIQNDWVSHLYKNNLTINHAYVSMRLNNNIINSIKNELVMVFDKYNISIREFKAIFSLIHIGGDNLFIVQQILFYMIAYRYKYHEDMIKYLNKYSPWYDFKKNHYLNIDQERFQENRLDNFSLECKDVILDLERFPIFNISDGIMSYINSLFGFINRSNRQNSIRLNLDKSANLFYSEFITVFLTSNNGGQNLYDSLSLNWHESFNQLSINCKNEFILAFNEQAETAVSINTQDHKFSYNLFLYQNFAILLLLMIRSQLSSNLEPIYLNQIYNYFQGDKLYNHSIRIYNQFYDTTVSFDIDIMVDYFRKLFNINHNTFEYDNTNQTLQNNYKELKDKLISDKTDPKFREIFTKIFKR